MEFRLLEPSEIDVRVSRILSATNGKGVSLLLYKDARCDMNILDETVGCMNWQRHHLRDNANCIVSVWDDEKKQWIEKEDTGTESNTEAEKGLASDSFKRACVNLGIGRELYTSPKDIIFWSNEANIEKSCYDRFEVTDIQYKNRQIETVTIKNQNTGVEKTFKHDKKKKPTKEQIENKENLEKVKTIESMKIAPVKAQALISKCEKENVSVAKLCSKCKVKGVTDLTEGLYSNVVNNWEKVKAECGN